MMKMAVGGQQAQSTAKRDQLLLAKLTGLQILLGVKDASREGTDEAAENAAGSQSIQNILNLKQSDVKELLEQCCDLIVTPEHQKLQDRVDQVMLGIKRRRQQEEEDGENEHESDNEEMKRFLKAIDLEDDDEGDQVADEDGQLQLAVGSNKYSILFIGLQTIEKLVGLEWAQKMGVMKHASTLGIGKKCLLFAQYHSVHWVRLIAQRIIGHVLTYHNAQEGKGKGKRMVLHEMLGLDIPEQLIQFTLDLVDCLRKPFASDELKDQFVKNLMYLVN